MIETMKTENRMRSSGFEIIKLKTFFESLDTSAMHKQLRTNYYSLIFLTEGQYNHEIDFIDYSVHEGETFIVSNNRVSKYKAFEDADGYLIMFTEGFLCEFLSNHTSEVKDLFKYSHLHPHIKTTDLHASRIASLLDVINDMYANANEALNEEVIASAFKTLAVLIKNCSKESRTDTALKNEMFVQFAELVERNIETTKSVEAYSKMMHVSEKTVNLTTRNAIDKSAKQYIDQQLLQRLRLKLSFEQKSINEISNDLGFSESSNMTRFFKRHTGISPKEFRLKVRTGKSDVWTDETIDLKFIKDSIEVKIYHISSDILVPFHKHAGHDEIFYCIKGAGFGVLEDQVVKLSVGKTFVAQVDVMHSIRSEGDLYVAAVLVPVIDKRV